MTAAILSFAPTPAPQPAPAPAPAPQADQGFARLLSQRQALAQPAPTQPGATAAQPAEGEAPAPKTAPQRTPAQRPQAEREPAKAEKARPAEAKATPAEEAPSAEKAEAGQDQEPIDPAIADWLAALNLPAQALPTERPEARGKLGKPAQDEDLGAQLADKTQGGTADPRAAQADDKATDALQAARDSRERASSTSATTAEASASQAEWQAALEHVQAPKEATDLHDAPGVNALASAAPTAQAQRSEATAAPVSVPVPTPVDAPDFAQSLGVQVSVLARDGVQQAELHLNPAEMGPISVQIAIEGTQAQVNFGADMAATRQVIESGLPELAAALRDAGFTLSGGGVHSQARGRDERGGSGPGRESGRGNAPGETEVTPRRTQARISAGGVDLYV